MKVCSKSELLSSISGREFDVLVSMGAGNIDAMAEPIVDLLTQMSR